jgi:hypothetical protein
MMSGTLPQIWKHSIVVPIPKKSNAQLVDNFRPISLLCPTSKIFEQIIHKKLSHHLESNNIIPPCQHGFRAHHSVTTQLLSVVDDLTTALDQGKCADIIYFDFKIKKLLTLYPTLYFSTSLLLSALMVLL